MRKSNLIFLALGVGLLIYLIHQSGPARIWHGLTQVNGLFFCAVGVFLSSKVLMAVAWRKLLDPEHCRASLTDLSLVTAVGGAINDVTPGGVGGEPLKVTWLQGKVPGEDLVSSLILHNYLYVMTNVILVLVGGVLLVSLADLPGWALWAVGGGMLLVVATVVALALVIRLGIAERFLRLLDKLHIRFKNADVLLEKARRTDERARSFYRKRPRALASAFVWMLAARATAAMESFFILAMLGHFVSPAEVLLITCMTVAVYVAFAFVPSQLGALEGGAYLFFPVIGLHAALGVAVEMIRRLRVLTLLGLAVCVIGGRSLLRWLHKRSLRDRGVDSAAAEASFVPPIATPLIDGRPAPSSPLRGSLPSSAGQAQVGNTSR
jgi:uncharacterized protein (TIRG00374 family)